MRGISDSYDELRLTLLCANTRHDFLRMSSDIAVRPAPELSDELVGEQAGLLEFAVYQTPNASPGWIGAAGPISGSVAATWLNSTVSQDQIRQRADSFVVMRELAAAGVGRAALPRIIADDDPRLTRIDGEVPPIQVPVWVAMLPDLMANTRFRIAQTLLLDGLSSILPRYCG